MDEIRADGKKWKARLSGGAFRRYKEATGKDFLLQGEADTVDTMTLAWAAACSGAKAEGTEMPPDLETFCDRLSLAELNGLGVWLRSQLAAQADPADSGDSKKKKETDSPGASTGS